MKTKGNAMSKDSGGSSGVGFVGLLQLLFIGLKLGNVIDWSWWWVLSPIWIPLSLFAVVVAFCGFMALVARAVSR